MVIQERNIAGMIITFKKTTGKRFISLLKTTLHYTVNTDTDTVTHRHT